ncbi:MAG: hypothetical protein K0R68_987 [Mycobacterium sp.]|jgi:hypothetical protein|nr:hypothetical protein [Mycobacterium sp.]
MTLAASLFGDNGDAAVARWLAAEFDRVDDTDFARTFSEHVRLPGVVSADFNHRVVRSARGALLGGIRFYGRDIARPFVEIICHDFSDLDALADCVRAEWARFDVRWARVHQRPATTQPAGAVLDFTVHAARCADLRTPVGRVSLRQFDDPETAVQVVAQRYRDIAISDPELAHNLRAAAPEDIRDWYAAGHVHAVDVGANIGGANIVGVLAVLPGQVLWIDGYEIHEEVISTAHRGHGYAAAAQSRWAHHLADDPQRLLLGTIDRLNAASRATALRAGRDVVLDAVFLRLPDVPPIARRGVGTMSAW